MICQLCSSKPLERRMSTNLYMYVVSQALHLSSLWCYMMISPSFNEIVGIASSSVALFFSLNPVSWLMEHQKNRWMKWNPSFLSPCLGWCLKRPQKGHWLQTLEIQRLICGQQTQLSNNPISTMEMKPFYWSPSPLSALQSKVSTSFFSKTLPPMIIRLSDL